MGSVVTYVSQEPRLKARGRPRTVAVGFDGSDCATADSSGLRRWSTMTDCW